MLFVREQSVDNLFICIGRLILEEIVLLGNRWRNPDQIEIDAPEERQLIRFRGGTKSLLLIRGPDERIHGIRRGRGRRNHGLFDRLQ